MKNILPHIISGFSGAFFAFIFMRLDNIRRSIVTRRTQHLQSLGQLEILFCDLATEIQENQYELDQFLHAYSLIKKSKSMVITPNRPKPFDFRDETFNNLCNEDLLNEIISYRAQINSINSDIITLWGGV